MLSEKGPDEGSSMNKLLGRLTFALALWQCAPLIASAQEANPLDSYIGAGARVRPAYEGASSNRGEAVPYLRFYAEHLFARTTQGILEGGIRTKPFGAVVFGAQLAYEEGRETAESAFLKSRNFEDIDPGASFGVHAEGDWIIGRMPLNALVRYRHHFDTDQGSQADFRLTAGIFSYRGINAGISGQLTWSDAESTQTFFGLTPQQSALTGLPVYAAGSGLRFATLGILGSVDVSPRWLILWGLRAQRALGDARDSPIVQDRNNTYANIGLAYRF